MRPERAKVTMAVAEKARKRPADGEPIHEVGAAEVGEVGWGWGLVLRSHEQQGPSMTAAPMTMPMPTRMPRPEMPGTEQTARERKAAAVVAAAARMPEAARFLTEFAGPGARDSWWTRMP